MVAQKRQASHSLCSGGFSTFSKKTSHDIGLYAQSVGLVYQSLGETNKAEKWLLKGVKYDAKNWSLFLNFVSFYKLENKLGIAKKYALKLKNLLPHPRSINGRSIFLRRVRDLIKELE